MLWLITILLVANAVLLAVILERGLAYALAINENLCRLLALTPVPRRTRPYRGEI